MNKPSLWLAQLLPGVLLAGCTLVFAEGDPPDKPKHTTSDAGIPSAAGASTDEGGAGALPSGGAGGQAMASGGQGGAVSEPAAGGAGGDAAGEPTPGLGSTCVDESSCLESAPECPAAAGFCTFYCDEAWVNGWQAVPDKVTQCEAQGGACTPIGQARSYCVPQ